MDSDTEQVRHPKQKRLLDVISSHGAVTAAVSLPRLGVADCETQHTSHSPDGATGSPDGDDPGQPPQDYIQRAVATKSAPDVATVREDVDTCPTVSATKSSPAVCQFEQICDNGEYRSQSMNCYNVEATIKGLCLFVRKQFHSFITIEMVNKRHVLLR